MTLSNAKIIFLQQTPYKPPIASFGMNLSQPIKFDRIIVSDALNGSLDMETRENLSMSHSASKVCK